MAATINIPWNEFEAILLVEACSRVISGEVSKSEIIPELSQRLRERMLRQGVEISETYRNENGIALQLSAMQYIMSNGEVGLSGGSALFVKMASLYSEDRAVFESKLATANRIYPPVKLVDGYDILEEKAIVLEDSHPVTYGSTPDNHDLPLNNKDNHVMRVLIKHFAKGYRLNSAIEDARFRRFYAKEIGTDVGSEVKWGDTIQNCGIQHENKVFFPECMLSNEIRDSIQLYILSHFESNDYIYYDAILDSFSDELVDSQIFDRDTLREYLKHYDIYGWNYRTLYITKSNQVEVDQDRDIIEFVRLHGGIVTDDEIYEEFHYMPQRYVEMCVGRNNRTLISCGRSLRFHIDNYRINQNEIDGIGEIIESSLQSVGYISCSELISSVRIKYPTVINDNMDFGTIGFRNVVYSLFVDRYSFYNNIISPKDKAVDTERVFADFCQTHKAFSLDEVSFLADDLETLIYFDTLSKYCVRVSQDKFVSKENILFDVPSTDRAIENYCKGDYIPIQDVDTFVAFPYSSYKWNNFLLESYVASYSNEFKLIHPRFNKYCTTGAIVKKTSSFDDFNDIIIDAVANSNIALTETNVLDFLAENGYIARRRANVITELSLLDKAEALRTKKKR